MLNFIAQWHSERVAVRELTRLPDHRLADLGIARADIKSIARAAASMARNGVVELRSGLAQDRSGRRHGAFLGQPQSTGSRLTAQLLRIG